MKPLAIQDVAGMVIEQLPEEEKERIAGMAKKDLIVLHFSLGTWIRNQWLWSIQYGHLVEGRHPDDVSMEIIHLVWAVLRQQLSSDERINGEEYE